jgi:glycosyltransferase involved in cell wall biosynthesis
MKILLVTEKCGPEDAQRDGGARLVETLQHAFGNSLSVMQFGSKSDAARWHFAYPVDLASRFERRLANATFIAEKVKAVEEQFTHVIFIHVSMQFGLIQNPLKAEICIWTFPMFLTPSYVASGESVPEAYFTCEKQTLAYSHYILTPSHLEKRQLIELYSVPSEKICVVPRGVNTKLFAPVVRGDQPLQFCSIGSIKPQKNTLGLIDLFYKICKKFSNAKLKVIGPVQNDSYAEAVYAKVRQFELSDAVEFTGYVPPEQLSLAIQNVQMHLSTSTCETFGRSIFETLAAGLPNIARATGNAAAEFLDDLPYARFVDDDFSALQAIEEMLLNYSKLSSMAVEVGELYNEELLSRLLVAKIARNDCMAISDYDGTLFHKNDPEKTQRCIEAFRQFPKRVICSARPVHDVMSQLKGFGLEVDWVIGCSGAVVANGLGQSLWITPLARQDVIELESVMSASSRIEIEDEVVQVTAPIGCVPNIVGLRVEVYQGKAFIGNWHASKLRSTIRLLQAINWPGRVCAFGDGPYDAELLTYFDGSNYV